MILTNTLCSVFLVLDEVFQGFKEIVISRREERKCSGSIFTNFTAYIVC